MNWNKWIRQIHRWMSIAFDKPELPAVEAHYAQMRSRPAAVAYLGAKTP